MAPSDLPEPTTRRLTTAHRPDDESNADRQAHVIGMMIGTALMFIATMAAWRLYQRQNKALATTRSLLDLNIGDRADLERDLRTRFRRREADTELRHTARIDRLSGEIAALQTLRAARLGAQRAAS